MGITRDAGWLRRTTALPLAPRCSPIRRALVACGAGARADRQGKRRLLEELTADLIAEAMAWELVGLDLRGLGRPYI
jgi:hypothetical protein